MLVTLTLVIVALVVLALAGFLALVAFALLNARKASVPSRTRWRPSRVTPHHSSRSSSPSTAR